MSVPQVQRSLQETGCGNVGLAGQPSLRAVQLAARLSGSIRIWTWQSIMLSSETRECLEDERQWVAVAWLFREP